ncbi:MAG: hypothetical protein WA771_09365 [Chthoniobacterales bacterium]
MPEDLIGGQAALMGHFSGRRARDYRKLLTSPQSLRVTVVGEPVAVQRRVYRHLVSERPELLRARPNVFGSEGAFLAARSDEVTSALGRIVGKRRVRVEDFDVVLVDERPEESLRKFVGVAIDWARRNEAPLRIVRTLEAARDFEGSLAEAFGGGEKPPGSALTPPPRAGMPGADRDFYAEAVRRLGGSGEPGVRRRFALPSWKSAKAPAGEPVFVFNHLPKSYGTSLRHLFWQAFGGIEDHTEFLGLAGLLDDAPADLGRLSADTLVCGHFTHGALRLQERYPEIWADAERYRLFTFVRDPLATAVSNFQHVRRHDAAAVAREPGLYTSLEKYLAALENPIAKRLGCDGGSVDVVLARYFFIGAAEKHVEGLQILLKRMREILDGASESATVERARLAVDWLAGQPLEHANAGDASDAGLAAGAEEDFRSRNALDYEIYSRAQFLEFRGRGGR